jgi:uncharacterized membrane protein YkgB
MKMSPMQNAELGQKLENAGKMIMRLGLALVLIWIGAMKFTEYEAGAIKPLVENSPLMSWVYSIFSVGAFAALLGTAEILLGLLIALRPFAPRLSAVGSALAAVMFLGTLSFILSTPGWEPSLGGFPALSVVPGQFLIKDLVFFGVAVWATGDALGNR